jgi:hypothetical protein
VKPRINSTVSDGIAGEREDPLSRAPDDPHRTGDPLGIERVAVAERA